MTNLTHIDLFSGIGGFALAARWAGIETIQFVEIDKFCGKILNKNFKGVPVHEDIKSFSFKSDIHPFLLTAGCPCQPASCAGKRRGKEDDRWLWDEAFRVLEESHPTWAIFENVAGLLSLEGGVVFDNLLAQLEGKGYEVWPVIIPACAVNAPHRRDRVWIVAHSTNSRVEGLRQERENPVFQNTGIISEGSGNTETEERGNGQSILAENVSRRPISNRGFGGIIAPDTKKPECEPSSTTRTGRDGLADNLDNAHDTEHNQAARHGQDGGRVLPITESEGLNNGNQWEQDWYSVALRTCVRGVDDGVSRGVDRVNRLKALGNAIVPQVAYQIMKSIIAVDEGCVD